MLFTIDHLRSISFFCQNAHHDWLTKEYISNWFLVSIVIPKNFAEETCINLHPSRETALTFWIFLIL